MPIPPLPEPREIRASLEVSRALGMSWEDAWRDAVGRVPDSSPENDERTLFRFMEKHFRAAYFNNDSALGRCLIPEFDISMALVMARHDPQPSNRERCRSGDGCDRLATRGRFGKRFCDQHGAELERLRMEPSAIKWNGAIKGLKREAA